MDSEHRDGNAPVVLSYLDGPTGDAALAAAATEARLRDTTLRVLHRMVGSAAPDRFGPDAGDTAPRREAMLRLLKLAHDAAPGVKHVDVKVVTEPIVEELLAASAAAALLVLGVTTDHVSTAMLFDTIPRTVVRDAHCPVMLVGVNAATTGDLVCGVDRSAASVAALGWAAEEAGLRGTTVLAVEATPSADDGPAAEAKLSTWVRHQLPAVDTTVLCATRRGSPTHVLPEIAAERGALLVIGAHPRNSGHALRSVTRAVTAQRHVPVVVVPENFTPTMPTASSDSVRALRVVTSSDSEVPVS